MINSYIVEQSEHVNNKQTKHVHNMKTKMKTVKPIVSPAIKFFFPVVLNVDPIVATKLSWTNHTLHELQLIDEMLHAH